MKEFTSVIPQSEAIDFKDFSILGAFRLHNLSTGSGRYMQPQPQVVGEPAVQHAVFPEGAILIEKQSNTPTFIGVLMGIAGLFGVLGGAWGLMMAADNIALLDEMNEDMDVKIDIPTWWIWTGSILQFLSGIAMLAGGVFLTQRKKLGVFLGLGSVGISVVQGLIESSLMAQVYSDLGADAAGIAGIGMIFTIVCNAICGLIIAMPLMMSNVKLE